MSHAGVIELTHVERLLNPALHIDAWDEKANVGVKQRSAAENAQIRTVRAHSRRWQRTPWVSRRIPPS